MANEMVVVAVMIAAVVLALVGLRRRPGHGGPRTQVDRIATGAVHPTAPDELAELELDRAMGRVSEADYERWKSELEADIHPVEPAPPPAVQDTRDATARAEDLVRQWREAPRPSCPTCGVRPQPDARFCSNCGAPLP